MVAHKAAVAGVRTLEGPRSYGASEHLDAAIAARTNWMFDHGLVDETRELLAAKRGPALRALRAIGYDEAIAILEGTWTAPPPSDARTSAPASRQAQRTWFATASKPSAFPTMRWDSTRSPSE